MCSIFHNRINYRGSRPNLSDSNSSLAKEFDADRNNNGSESTIMSLKAEATIESREDNKTTRRPTGDLESNVQEDNEDEEDGREGREAGQEEEDEVGALDLSIISNRLPGGGGHVALEALKHTKVAVAQFAATALTHSHRYGNAVNELAMMQSTIFNVQRQHMMQLQLIQHLQSQLKRVGHVNSEKQPELLEQQDPDGDQQEHQRPPQSGEYDGETETVREGSQKDLRKDHEAITQPDEEKTSCGGSVLASADEEVPKYVTEENKKTEEPSAIDETNRTIQSTKATTTPPTTTTAPAISSSSSNYQPLMCDISSTLASSIITNHDPPPAPNEPNCLEVLQRRTEEVLDSASQSLHAAQLQEEYECAQKEGQARGEIFKHRCKYCGKIFGSYSALQIHLRSHTGERPFHCNVCGSKFTTKGNLKVHYQRHTQIYPPILLPTGVGPPPSGTAEPQQLLVGVNRFLPSASLGGMAPLSIRLPFPPKADMEDGAKENCAAEESRLEGREGESQLPAEIAEKTLVEEPQARAVDLTSVAEAPEDLSKPHASPERESVTRETEQPAPPTLSEKVERPANSGTIGQKRSSSARKRNSSSANASHEARKQRLASEEGELGEQHCLPKPYRRSSGSRNPSNAGSMEHISGEFSLAQMERIIDKSWEDLIEIDKTSETSKLQQLVDNIENKLTDPNQCVFCQKVMSCRSSLQMHIRTHTGERPFRCKICGRAFATKGNLKAHMSIHKIKPPMRSQFKCPVCHQKFSNGIILQQHIRIHTIDDGSGGGGGGGGGGAGGGGGSMPVAPPSESGSSELAATGTEHNGRSWTHFDGVTVDDQNSNKSISASDNFDFSTTSEYSGQRSESSQGDFDEFMTTESTDDSRENASAGTPLDKRPPDECETRTKHIDYGELAGVMDLSSRAGCVNGMTHKSLDHLPGLLGLPHNFLLMAAAREEMHAKFPLLPFTPLGFMGLHPHAPICHLCYRIFPNAALLEHHFQSEHTKDAANTSSSVNGATATPTPTSITSPSPSTTTTTAAAITNISSHSSSNLTTTIANRLDCDRTTTSPFNAKHHDEDERNPSGPRDDNGSGDYEGNVNESLPEFIKREPQTDTTTNNNRNDVSSFNEDEEEEEDNCQQSLQLAKPSPLLLPLAPSTSLASASAPASSSSFSATSSDLPSAGHHADAEQSLIKMQMLSSLPHNAPHHPSTPQMAPLEAHRFPASPLDFQQALMSVGPPSTGADQPANNKHFCHICRRNFSSSSALQIHMRTHTGDKPFQCNVCQKAFTTKGNLKVHMGTHMWTNPTSRRGRRMSLELPMHRAGGGLSSTESDFVPRRPDLFFPYLPPFFNGLPPRSGDVSPTAFPHNLPPQQHFPNGGCSTPKYPPTLGLGFSPFLAPSYNFAPLSHSVEALVGGQVATSPSEESNAAESPPTGSEHTPWSPLMKIKTENNQNESNHHLECSKDISAD